MTHGLISAAQPEAAEAGADVLAAGGNAIDAAIAAALVQTAVDPFMCGIAGFGSAHVYSAEKNEHRILDFHGRAPMAVKPDMWADRIIRETEDGYGFLLKGQVNEIGYGAITTPMTLRALDATLSRYGTQSFASLMAYAIDHLEQGVMVRPHTAAFWRETHTKGRVPHPEYLKRLPTTAKIYLKPDGSILQAGERLQNPDMANTYRRIADAGVDDFYAGDIAERIVADMQQHGGRVSQADLDSVKLVDNKPLWGSYRGLRIATNPPPGGGLMVLEMLNILENFDLVAMGHNSPDYIHCVAEAMKIATIDKDAHIGDPAFVTVPVERLASKDYARERAADIKAGKIAVVERMNPGGKESEDTTQVTVVDEHQNVVSLTHSLGMPSGVITDGLGFMYNGCMGVFDPRPGRTGSLAPGKSRFTAMCPTIVFGQDDKPFFVTGAPGATYITMGVLQSILNAVDFGMDAQQAVSAPRISATSNRIELSNRILRRTEKALQQKGHQTSRAAGNFVFSGVHAIRIVDGVADGGADPGRDGMAIAV